MEVKPMQGQNITLSLPKDIIKKAKIVAIKKDTSLSNLIRPFSIFLMGIPLI